MSIRISQLKDHFISVDQARYTTSIVAKYLDTATVKVSTKFYKTILPADMIFTKEDVSTSYEQVEKFTREIQHSLQIFHRFIDLYIVYKSGPEFCSTQVSKVFSESW